MLLYSPRPGCWVECLPNRHETVRQDVQQIEAQLRQEQEQSQQRQLQQRQQMLQAGGSEHERRTILPVAKKVLCPCYLLKSHFSQQAHPFKDPFKDPF